MEKSLESLRRAAGVCVLLFLSCGFAQAASAEKWTSDFAEFGAGAANPHGKLFVKDAESGETLARFDGSFAPSPEGAQWTSCVNMAPFKGRALKFEFLEADSKAAPRLVSARPAQQWGFKADPSSESFRPKFHFTAPVGWHNDPNGLIYIDGVWHMFYQYNPFSLRWAAPMQWGYAKSRDLVNWQYCGIALWAKGNSQMFSGTAYADFGNRSGLFPLEKGGVIFALTDTALGECVYLSDDMSSFREAESNPIIPAINKNATAARDPRIFFNEDSGLWTVVRYERARGVDGVAFYVSENLKDWTRTDFVKALYECPDIAKLNVENTGEYKWLLIDASFNYAVGDFDGRKFIEEKGRKADGSRSLKDIFSAEKFVSRRVANGVYATQFFCEHFRRWQNCNILA